MARTLIREPQQDDIHWVLLAGADDEEKPTEGICDLSVYVSTDEKKVYLFDEENKTWRKW